MMSVRWGNALAIVVVVAGIAAGCTNGAEPQRAAKTALALQSSFPIALPFPAGHSQGDVALYATDALNIADRVVLDDAAGAPAPAVNVGTAPLHLGAEAHTGTLIAGGDISLDSRAVVTGDAQSAGIITTQDGVVVTGASRPNTPIGTLSSLRFTVQFPTPGPSLLLQNGQSAALDPGAYTSVVVNAQSTLSLRSGSYYLDSLQTEPMGTLSLDTRNGAIVMYVRGNLNFKGTIELNGPPGSFLLGYVGTDATSIESPFHGAIVAPFASLRLAPVGAIPGHRGAFFAKQLNVEAGSTITFEPFTDWFDVLDLRPLVDCVRRYKEPNGAALFGYDNSSDFPVTVPLGSANLVTPGSASPPVVLEPGHHPRAFWAPFDLGSTVTWSLAGDDAVATGANQLCSPGETLPEDQPGPSGPVALVDRPTELGPTAKARILPDVVTDAFSVLPAPRFGGTLVEAPSTASGGSTGPIGTVQQGLSAGANAPTGPFTFQVTALNYSGDEGLCGTVDPFVKNLIINGQSLGNTDHGTVQVPRNQPTVPVHIEVWDSDGGLCFGDDLLAGFDIEIDNFQGGTECTPGGDGSMCWTAQGAASPAVCFDWNAQFLDAGPWGDGVPSEDFDVSKGIQSLPASFARLDATIQRQGTTVYEFGGFLDQDGCIPSAKLPSREDWTPGGSTVATFRLTSQLCLDPTGADCPQGGAPGAPTYTGANVIVLPAGATGPASLCSVVTEDPALVTDPKCTVQTFDWTALPPNPIKPRNIEENGVTRTAAVVSRMFAREVETNGGLGIEAAMVDRRFEGNGLVNIHADEFCCIDGFSQRVDCSNASVVKKTSCRDGNDLFLEPDNVVVASTRYKYVVAHEFGHFVQGNGQGLMSQSYGTGAGEPGQGPLCRCDHVPADDNLHCLQSLEEPNAAEIEGYAQFFAAKVWNTDLQNDCTFVYYKNFANTSCMPGVDDCSQDPNTGLFVSMPPVPVSCRSAVLWRNQHCVDAASSPDVLAFGTEFDWLEFLYGINNDPAEDQRWTMLGIFNAYLTACGANDPQNAKTCTNQRVSWAGDPSQGEFSLVQGAEALAGGALQPAAQAFRKAGNDFGVSNEP